MFKVYEKNGRYYFEYGMIKIETTELIDAELVVYDKDFGYIYKSKLIEEYQVKEQPKVRKINKIKRPK